MPKTLLLWSGVAAAALYVAIVEIGAELTPGYSHVAQPVSSLYQSGATLGVPIALATACQALIRVPVTGLRPQHELPAHRHPLVPALLAVYQHGVRGGPIFPS